jgi:hypothetical protein
MAKPKLATKRRPAAISTSDSVEPMVIALAEQLGTFLGRVQKKADGWLENEALRRQVSQIRDGATQLLASVNRASTAARKSAAKAMPVAKTAARQARGSTAAPKKRKLNRSGGTVDAQGKHHRKPPPEEMFDPRLGEPMGKQMGQKSVKNGMRRGRG